MGSSRDYRELVKLSLKGGTLASVAFLTGITATSPSIAKADLVNDPIKETSVILELSVADKLKAIRQVVSALTPNATIPTKEQSGGDRLAQWYSQWFNPWYNPWYSRWDKPWYSQWNSY